MEAYNCEVVILVITRANNHVSSQCVNEVSARKLFFHYCCWPLKISIDRHVKCQSIVLTLKQICASTLWDIRGGKGRTLLLCWHLFLSKSTACKGHRLIMLFTAVKIHIVEMSWHYYSSISSGAVIFTHWMSVHVKHWLGTETTMESRSDRFTISCDWWTEKEQNSLLVS